MTYLDNCTEPEMRQPYYWAGFIVQGNISPLEFSSNTSVLLLLLGGILGVIILGVAQRKKS